MAAADKPTTVVESLSRVMNEVQAISKDQRNTEQGYNFRGVDAVVNVVGPILRKHGVIVLPMLEEMHWRDVRTARDKPSREVTLKVTYRFYGPGGDFIDATVPGESMDVGDKGAAKAMSVAYRIVLLQALCIPTDEVDPDAQSYERADPPAAAPSDKAVALFEQITTAADEPALKQARADLVAAREADEVTEAEGIQLNEHIKKRKAELVPS